SSLFYEPIVSSSLQNLSPFDASDFLLLEVADAFIAIDDEPISSNINATYYDPEGDILILEALLNNDPEPLSNQKDYFLTLHNDLKRCLMAIFHDMIERTMEEKSHFMVKEGIVLGHKISKKGIEVDKAKIEVISKLPHPTTEFDFKVIDTRGAKNYAADHLSQLENPYENVFDPKEINEAFPLETLNKIAHNDPSTPWARSY
nr:reverse transcriptase domain-containing protein [Tanacetum cinerariifolium]